MKNIIIIVLSIALLVEIYRDKEDEASVNVKANVERHMTPELEDVTVRQCMDDVDLAAFKNVQRTACYVAEVARLEVIRVDILKELTNQSPLNTQQNFLDAEEAWRYSRDAWCNYIGSLPMAPLPLFNRQYCLADEATKHIQALRVALNEVRSIQED
jgi:hypothetical protein